MSGVSPEIRKQKLQQIQRYHLWNKISEGLMTLLMPGLRSLRRGRVLTGAVICGIWIFLVSALASLPTLLPRIGLHASGWSLNPLMMVLAVLTIVFWSVNLLAWLLKSLSRGDWRPLGTVGPGTGGGEEENS